MASVGIFFGSDTGNTEAVAKMIQKQLGKQLVHVQDIAKSSKEDIDNFDLLLLGIPTGITVKHNVTGMISSLSLSKSTSQLSLLLSLVAVTKKITQSTSVMQWARYVISSKRKAELFSVTLRLKAMSLKHQRPS